jgi:hypothetical protein
MYSEFPEDKDAEQKLLFCFTDVCCFEQKILRDQRMSTSFSDFSRTFVSSKWNLEKTRNLTHVYNSICGHGGMGEGVKIENKVDVCFIFGFIGLSNIHY